MNLIGKIVGRLTVEEFAYVKNQQRFWKCRCLCGKTTYVNTYCINKEKVLSCGCLQKERIVESCTKHGKSTEEIYKRWVAMKARCKKKDGTNYDKNNISYCKDWEIFENFYNDMIEQFSPELELDRIDVMGDYCKENCRWVSHSENNFNKNLQSNNKSGKTGVNYIAEIGKYRAYITKNNRQIHLGLFTLFEDAVEARKNAEIELYGYTRQ